MNERLTFLLQTDPEVLERLRQETATMGLAYVILSWLMMLIGGFLLRRGLNQVDARPTETAMGAAMTGAALLLIGLIILLHNLCAIAAPTLNLINSSG